MLHYRVSGLSVASEFELPGMITRSPSPADEVDVRVVHAAVDADIPDAGERGPNWQMAGERFVLTVPGIARMLVLGGREIRVAPADGASIAQAAIFVCGTGFGILLHQRRQMVLHASAVRVGQAAVLFCGPSGAGKSTLAAALGERGHDLVADDFCAISIRDGVPWLEPDGRRHKLWQHSITAMSMEDRREAPVRTEIEKYFVAPRVETTSPLPIAAIYRLHEARPPRVPGIAQPNIVDAALLIRRNAYRPPLVARMAHQDLYFQGAAAIAHKAGIYTLSRPLRFAAMPKVLGWLDDHWHSLGLMDRAA